MGPQAYFRRIYGLAWGSHQIFFLLNYAYQLLSFSTKKHSIFGKITRTKKYGGDVVWTISRQIIRILIISPWGPGWVTTNPRGASAAKQTVRIMGPTVASNTDGDCHAMAPAGNATHIMDMFFASYAHPSINETLPYIYIYIYINILYERV